MENHHIIWDIGTAYDFFISLRVIHRPEEFDIRPSWAAGIRARMDSRNRQTLELFSKGMLDFAPFSLVSSLPHPKNGLSVLDELKKISQREVLHRLFSYQDFTPEMKNIMRKIEAKKGWNETLRNLLQKEVQHFFNKKNITSHILSVDISKTMDIWSQPEETGDKILEALCAYYDLFFKKEEKRIEEALYRSISHAKLLSNQYSRSQLLEILSGGLLIPEIDGLSGVVFAPSYWITPLLYYGVLESDKRLYVYGARPPEISLIPGNSVPDDMTRALKAISDPTRLNILKYLSKTPMTPGQLAKELCLRAPTITHHLKILRLARLVRITFNPSTDKETKYYETRKEEADHFISSIRDFIGIPSSDVSSGKP